MNILTYLVPTGILLGVGIPLARQLAGHGVTPLAFAFWPTLAASLLLAALALRGRVPAWRADVVRFSVTAGLGGYALPMTAAFWLSSNASAALTSLAFTLPPLFTLAINLLLRREQPRAGRVAAVGIGFAGALLMATRGLGEVEPRVHELVLVLLIPALIAATNVYRSLHLPAGVTPALLGAGVLAAAALGVLLLAQTWSTVAVPLTAQALPGLVAQCAALVIGYILYFELQKRADPVTFSFLGYITMLTGGALAIVWLGEPVSWTAVPAALLILTALWMLAR
jgi:drug/metabolite transporter (DMT)-like permease